MFHSMSEGLFKNVRNIEVLWSIRNNIIVIQEVNQVVICTDDSQYVTLGST